MCVDASEDEDEDGVSVLIQRNGTWTVVGLKCRVPGLVRGLRCWAALLGCVGQVSLVSPYLLFSFSVLFSVFNSGFIILF
jgi:hypothetical protein